MSVQEYKDRILSAEEVWVMWNTGHTIVENGVLSTKKVRRILLPHPQSCGQILGLLESIAYSDPSISRSGNLSDLVKNVTDKALAYSKSHPDDKLEVKWWSGWFGNPLTIGFPHNKDKAWVIVEQLIPYHDASDRPFLLVERNKDKTLFERYKTAYDQMWDSQLSELATSDQSHSADNKLEKCLVDAKQEIALNDQNAEDPHQLEVCIKDLEERKEEVGDMLISSLEAFRLVGTAMSGWREGKELYRFFRSQITDETITAEKLNVFKRRADQAMACFISIWLDHGLITDERRLEPTYHLGQERNIPIHVLRLTDKGRALNLKLNPPHSSHEQPA